ncbi:MAG: CD225/dispanin family protein [Flavobacteriales bacterium]|nr:CD225/dispanin family protein [Flavobacteriales bacterium]HRH69791.1 CD225/dispanin family protein [Flavobacteriales bacterium]
MEQINPTPRPKNWLVESILVTLFCCLPFGIVGIINAANVNSKFDGGDVDGAIRASAEAGKWTKLGFWVGVGIVVLYVALIALGVGGAILGAAALE